MSRPAKYDDTALLDASVDLLWRDGCDAVSIRDLEIALGIKAPSIYRRFHSRDELIARSVDRYVDRVVLGRIRRYLDSSDDPVEGLHEFFLTALDPPPGASRSWGCMLTVTATQAGGADAGVSASVDAGLAALDEAFHRQVERALRSGRLDPDADVDALATSLLVAFEGLVVLARNGHPGLAAGVDALFTSLFTCFDAH